MTAWITAAGTVEATGSNTTDNHMAKGISTTVGHTNNMEVTGSGVNPGAKLAKFPV